MYQINYNKVSHFIEVENAKNRLYAKIYLNQGASLRELTLNGHAIIRDLSPLTYDDTYASSILFPFANRVKDGEYMFKGKVFKLETNQKEENNALHGLVYNKSFEVVESKTEADCVSILLQYNEINENKGFPYTFNIQIKYEFRKDVLALKVTVKNTSAKAFPFTLGWHPYFHSENLYESEILMDSTCKIILGDRNITTGTTKTSTELPIKIENKQLDDCWALNSDKVLFKTPKYDLQFNASGNNNFLQVYTPPKANTIAIEPTTGVSDSYNNKLGLEVLKPNEVYTIEWLIKII